jgi:hypothetical protein
LRRPMPRCRCKLSTSCLASQGDGWFLRIQVRNGARAPRRTGQMRWTPMVLATAGQMVLDAAGLGARRCRSRCSSLLMQGRFDQQVTLNRPHATGLVRIL